MSATTNCQTPALGQKSGRRGFPRVLCAARGHRPGVSPTRSRVHGDMNCWRNVMDRALLKFYLRWQDNTTVAKNDGVLHSLLQLVPDWVLKVSLCGSLQKSMQHPKTLRSVTETRQSITCSSRSSKRSNFATLRETWKVSPESVVSNREYSMTGSFSEGVLIWMNHPRQRLRSFCREPGCLQSAAP